jgi:hypothetical protein
MSIWGEVAGQTSAIVLGVAGIYATYRSGASHGREARHHARVEQLYQEMLTTASDEYGSALRAAGFVDVQESDFEDTGNRRTSDLERRIDLFASPNVSDAWGDLSDSLDNLWLLEHLQKTIDIELADAVKQHSTARAELIEQMRIDLGVLRTGARRSQLRRFRNRRIERLAVQRHQAGQQRTDPPPEEVTS